jgi:hypothetical protein
MLAGRAFCLWVAASTGCAQISATTEVRTVPVAGARPLSIERRVIERQVEARWLQRGDTLAIELIEHRRCQVVERIAAVREEHSVRRADAAIYWEYGLAAVLLGLAAFSFARPDLFAAPEDDPAGEKRDPKTGYRLGGVFAGLGAAALGAGVYDTVRARDRVYRSDTVALRTGPAADCEQPSVPASQRRLALQLGEFRSHVSTDLEGRARFVLPGPELWPEQAPAPVDEMIGVDGADEANAPARAQQRRWAGTLTVGQGRSVALEVVLPYEATAQVPSTGAGMSAPR